MRFQRWMAAAACAAALGWAGLAGAARPDASGRPKLVVVLVVDQMRADYVVDYGHNWTGGLRRLVDRGASFTRAAYPYLNTFTCAGHATIATGSFPASHGIINNSWWDRKSDTSNPCTADPDSHAVGYGEGVKNGGSAAQMKVPSLAEELRARFGGRVVTFSLKARAAIPLAGAHADAVTWFDAPSWATSTSYSAAPVPFVQAFIAAHPVEKDFGKSWTRVLPANAYLYDESGAGERPPPGWTTTFPHPLKGLGDKLDAAFYQQWEESPFSDAYLGAMAEAAVDALGLGKGAGTDFLGVSFSALDLVGHGFGPRSHEVQDVLARLDRTIGALLSHLDRTVGAGNYVVALSADHGVAPIPEQFAGPQADSGRVNPEEVVARVNKTLAPLLGSGPAVAQVEDSDLYFAPGVYDRVGANPATMQAVLDAIQSIPGVARVLRSEELRKAASSDDRIARAAALGYFPGRSGDLIVVQKPNWIFSEAPYKGSTGGGTTHGSPYFYDQDVPLFLMGWGIRQGKYSRAATPADIAPTLAALCGFQLPRTDGRVLKEALINRRAQLNLPGAAGANADHRAQERRRHPAA